MLQWIFLAICGLSGGILVSAGVFTVLLAVGLVPRFAGKTHTASKIFLYEETVIWGTLFGNAVSVFEDVFAAEGSRITGGGSAWADILQNGFLVVLGLFAGIFVGCLALAIAEMLDSIPIFTRRIGLRHGLGFMILATALGKLVGSLLYFGKGFVQITL